MNKALTYARVSTDDQTENRSLAGQRQATRDVAHRRGLEIIGEYADEGISAKSLEDVSRPGFEAMLTFAADHLSSGDYIIAYDASRLFRNLADAMNVRGGLERRGIGFIANGQTYEPTSDGLLRWGFDSLLANVDNMRKSEQTTERMRRLALQGRWTGRSVFGYVVGSNAYPTSALSLVLVPEEADIIREIFSRVSLGEPTRLVARSLMANSVWRTRYRDHDERTHERAVRTRLRDLKYTGYFATKLTDGVVVTGDWEPIVSTEAFERANKMMNNQKYAPKPDTNERFPHLTLLYCSFAGCGRQYTSSSPKQGRYAYYHCGSSKHTRKTVKVDEAEQIVTGLLGQIRIPPSFMDAVVLRIRELVATETKTAQLRRLHLNNQLTAVRAEIEDLVRTSINRSSGIKKTTLMRMIAKQEEQETLILDELRATVMPSDDFVTRAILVAENTFGDPVAIWNQLGVRQRVGFAKAIFGEPIRLHGAEVQTPAILAASGESSDLDQNEAIWQSQRDSNPRSQLEKLES